MFFRRGNYLLLIWKFLFFCFRIRRVDDESITESRSICRFIQGVFFEIVFTLRANYIPIINLFKDLLIKIFFIAFVFMTVNINWASFLVAFVVMFGILFNIFLFFFLFHVIWGRLIIIMLWCGRSLFILFYFIDTWIDRSLGLRIDDYLVSL